MTVSGPYRLGQAWILGSGSCRMGPRDAFSDHFSRDMDPCPMYALAHASNRRIVQLALIGSSRPRATELIFLRFVMVAAH